MAETKDKQMEQKTKKSSVFLRTLKYFLRYKFSVTVLMAVYLLLSAVSVVWPYMTGKVLFDHVLEKDDEYLAQYGMAGKYLLALVLVGLCVISRQWHL